jgi:hypothetical protein
MVRDGRKEGKEKRRKKKRRRKGKKEEGGKRRKSSPSTCDPDGSPGGVCCPGEVCHFDVHTP